MQRLARNKALGRSIMQSQVRQRDATQPKRNRFRSVKHEFNSIARSTLGDVGPRPPMAALRQAYKKESAVPGMSEPAVRACQD